MVRPPNLSEQVLPGHEFAWIVHKDVQDAPLSRSETDDLPFAVESLYDLFGGEVDAHGAELDNGVVPRVHHSPRESPDASEQFIDRERLGDVVIRAGIQSVHLVRRVRTARDDQDRYLGPSAERLHYLDTVELRHSQIQHHQVGAMRGGQVQRLDTVVGGDDVVAAGAERDLECAEDLWIVVCDQYLHRPLNPRRWSRRPEG